MFPFFMQVNFWAILLAAIVFWLAGTLWFSVLFGKTWSREMEYHGIKIRKPGAKQMFVKSVATFLLNFFVCFGIAIVVYLVGSATFLQALWLGLVLGIFFSAAAMCISYVWESRSMKLTLIDIGYPVLGITLATIILTLWR